jgi:hypothetical protein
MIHLCGVVCAEVLVCECAYVPLSLNVVMCCCYLRVSVCVHHIEEMSGSVETADCRTNVCK